MRFIDLRSDTVTQPTDEMREAIYRAQVGDDVYGDDATVNRLEELAASLTGKEAALFLPSGTMGNQVAILTHTVRGNEIILGENCHIVVHELGAAAVLSGACFRTIKSSDHMLHAEAVRRAIRADDIHIPPTGLICMENALATGGVMPLETMAEVYAVARERGIPVHTDGARLFNAAAALGVEASELCRCTDSVMFCLSKGLCAPVGSMLAGTRAFIARARKNRKLLGGGMRQAGFLAAAGIVALEKMRHRLAEDHENARYMAGLLSALPGVTVDESRLAINMVFFTLPLDSAALAALPAKMLERGIKINGPEEDGEMRFVTSNGVSREDVKEAVEALSVLLT